MVVIVPIGVFFSSKWYFRAGAFSNLFPRTLPIRETMVAEAEELADVEGHTYCAYVFGALLTSPHLWQTTTSTMSRFAVIGECEVSEWLYKNWCSQVIGQFPLIL